MAQVFPVTSGGHQRRNKEIIKSFKISQVSQKETMFISRQVAVVMIIILCFVTQQCLPLCDLLACQALLSMGFFRQEYWSGLPFPLPGHLPDPRTEPENPASPRIIVDSLPTEPSGGSCITFQQFQYSFY